MSPVCACAVRSHRAGGAAAPAPRGAGGPRRSRGAEPGASGRGSAGPRPRPREPRAGVTARLRRGPSGGPSRGRGRAARGRARRLRGCAPGRPAGGAGGARSLRSGQRLPAGATRRELQGRARGRRLGEDAGLSQSCGPRSEPGLRAAAGTWGPPRPGQRPPALGSVRLIPACCRLVLRSWGTGGRAGEASLAQDLLGDPARLGERSSSPYHRPPWGEETAGN